MCLSVVRHLFFASTVLVLAGCDQLGIETPQKTAERQVAEAKAVGGACRHALRAIEDCYTLNPKAEKSAVYEGWREMDEYMRENKLEGIAPVVPRPAPAASAPKKRASDSEDEDVTEESSVDHEPAKTKKGH
ncbi:MAG TPA: hypothetical protein VFW72_06320 [Aquabacterium sp.]|nr:hypothetical protein [Aquabacterium sp.]HEX5311404.1 hypothetical protein [Aquabacterium sp.]